MTNVTSTSAVLHGVATEGGAGSTWFFEYGTTTSYGRSTPSILVTSGAEDVSATVTGLLPGTTYHYRLVVVGSYNQQATGNDATFMTLAAPGSIATTGQATGVTGTTAELNGVVNTTDPAPQWLFQYGRTRTYGHTTATHSVRPGLTLVSVKITGLRPQTIYHFRLIVKQSESSTADGRDHALKTAESFGRATVKSHRLKIRRGTAAIAFLCAGVPGSVCKARVSMRTRAKVGKHFTVVACGRGRLAMTAVHRRAVSFKVGSRCGSLLRRARHGELRATLSAVFSTHQRRLQTTVTLKS